MWGRSLAGWKLSRTYAEPRASAASGVGASSCTEGSQCCSGSFRILGWMLQISQKTGKGRRKVQKMGKVFIYCTVFPLTVYLSKTFHTFHGKRRLALHYHVKRAKTVSGHFHSSRRPLVVLMLRLIRAYHRML